MGEKGRFKFQKPSQVSRELNVVLFDDVIRFVAPADAAIDQGCFVIFCVNTLRCKELVKFKNGLKHIVNTAPKGTFSSIDSLTISWRNASLDSLLQSAQDADEIELMRLLRLAAALFRDFGNNPDFELPFKQLRELLEKNIKAHAKAIFAFVATCSRIHSRVILKRFKEWISHLEPWLSHGVELVRRLTNDCIGAVLRKCQGNEIFDHIPSILESDGGGRVLFALLKNVDGTFTSRMPAIFNTCTGFIKEMGSCNKSRALKCVNSMREWIGLMARHSKGKLAQTDWLLDAFNDALEMTFKSDLDFMGSCLILEITTEACLVFNPSIVKIGTDLHLKDPQGMQVLISNLVMPLISFCKQNAACKNLIFESISKLLLHHCKASSTIQDNFDNLFDLLVSVKTETADLQSLVSLVEWRLDSSCSIHVATAAANIHHITSPKFHPFYVSPKVVERLVSHIVLGPKWTKTQLYINFSCLYGICTINRTRSNLKVPPISLEASQLESIKKASLDILNMHDTSEEQEPKQLDESKDKVVALCVFKMALEMYKGNTRQWLEALVKVLKMETYALRDWRTIEMLHLHYIDAMAELVPLVVDNLPSNNPLVRIHTIRLVERYIGPNHFSSSVICHLMQLEQEYSSMPQLLQLERSKCIGMERAVEALITLDDTLDVPDLLLVLSCKILASQYLVKFQPLWTSAYKAITMLAQHAARKFPRVIDAMFNVLVALLPRSQITQDQMDLVSTKEPIDNAKSHTRPESPCSSYENATALDKVVGDVLQFRENDLEPVGQDVLCSEFCKVFKELLPYSKERKGHLKVLVDLVDGFKDSRVKILISTLARVLKESDDISLDLIHHCMCLGISSEDATIRKGSLRILALAYPKQGLDRLESLAGGNFTLVENDKGSSELYGAIKTRLLVPKILQRQSSTVHNKAMIDFISTLDSHFILALFLEILPTCISSSAFKWANKLALKLKALPEILSIGENHDAKPSLSMALKTCLLLVQRLQNRLEIHGPVLMDACCQLLLNLNPKEHGKVIKMLFSLAIELVEQIPLARNSYLDVLTQYMQPIIDKFATGGRIIAFIRCWTCKGEYFEQICKIARGAFPEIFKSEAALEIALDIYGRDCTKTVKLGPEMEKLMLECAPTLLDTLIACEEINFKHSRFFGNVIMLLTHLVRLDLDHGLLLKTLEMLLCRIPTRNHLTRRQTPKAHASRMHCLRLYLALVKLLFQSLESHDNLLDNARKAWQIVDRVLEFVLDASSRKMASEILMHLPQLHVGQLELAQLLVGANTVDSRALDAKIDLDENLDMFLKAIEIMKSQWSLACMHTMLIHTSFVIWTNQSDPALSRCARSLVQIIFRHMRTHILDVDATGLNLLESIKFALDFSRRVFSSSDIPDVTVNFALEILRLIAITFSGMDHLNLPHADLYWDDFAQVCVKLGSVQRQTRIAGIRDLSKMQPRLTENTKRRIVMPLCTRFMESNDEAFCKAATGCLASACIGTSFKGVCKLLLTLLDRPAFTKAMGAVTDILAHASLNPLKQSNLPDSLLHRLKGLTYSDKTSSGEELQNPQVYEAIGTLLSKYPLGDSTRHVVHLTRICAKCLSSRDRKVRRLARASLSRLLGPLGIDHYTTIVLELSHVLTRGFQVPVLCFTSCAILSNTLGLDPTAKISLKDAQILHGLIASELARMQTRQEGGLVDEARHPRAAIMVSLLGEHGDYDVVVSTWQFLASLLLEQIKIPTSEYLLVHDQRLLAKVQGLMDSMVQGMSKRDVNRALDIAKIARLLVFANWPHVRTSGDCMQIIAPCQLEDGSLEFYKERKQEIKDNSYSCGESPNAQTGALGRRVDLMTLLPGTATGRGPKVEQGTKFELPIVAPMLLTSALRLVHHALGQVPNFSVMWDACEMERVLVACYSLKDIGIQRVACQCITRILQLGKSLNQWEDTSEILIARLLTLALQTRGNCQLDLAAAHVKLASLILGSCWRNQFLENAKCVSLNWLNIVKFNLACTELQAPLCRLLDALNPWQDPDLVKELDAIVQVLLETTLQNKLTRGALEMAPKILALHLLLGPHTESERSKRIGILIKHLNSGYSSVRLAVLKTVGRVIAKMPQEALAKYRLLITTAIAKLAVTDDCDECKKKMRSITSQLWSGSNFKQRQEMVACVAHFTQQQRPEILAYFCFCCAHENSSGTTSDLLRSLDSIEKDIVITNLLGTCGDLAGYYWMRVFEHICSSGNLPNLFQTCENGDYRIIGRLWELIQETSRGTKLHPWKMAASFRATVALLQHPKPTLALVGDYETFGYAIVQPAFRLFMADMLERHTKLGDACMRLICTVLELGMTTKHTAIVIKIISKTCHVLRRNLSRCGGNIARLRLLVQVLAHACNVPTFLQRKQLRVAVLRILVALYKIVGRPVSIFDTIKKRRMHIGGGRNFKRHQQAHYDFVEIKRLAQSVLGNIEAGFSNLQESQEHLKLASFARNFVLQQRLISKRTRAHAAILDPKKAAQRKLWHHSKGSRKRKRNS
ncbi:Armadillo-type fold [Babesia duncani]|uniref:Armadillo-type fold n=1 Tax=Babesia duncani TaxID=323732 RepID=A0AAD9PMA3_9APIC|nr:Armadillo-type fold [Babesia duncani]